MQFGTGHVVVKEGEFAFKFYAIVWGAAQVRRGGERIGQLGAGDVFGELGVVPDDSHRWTRRRGASVIVTEPTEAIMIDGGDLRHLVEQLPALCDALHATALARSGGDSS